MKTKKAKVISETPEYKNLITILGIISTGLMIYVNFKRAQKA